MITFSCPGCQATFRLPDAMAGKAARCSKCNHKFSVPGPAATSTVPAPTAAPGTPTAPSPATSPAAVKKVPLKPVPEVLEAELVEDEPPLPARPAAAPRRPAHDDVEVVDEIDDDLPRSRRERPRGDDDYDDREGDDYDEERPRRRRRRRAGSLGWVLAMVGGISFVLSFVFLIMMMVSGGPGGGGVIINNQLFVGGNFVDMNQLGAFDPPDRQFANRGSRAKTYRQELHADKTYVIELQSAVFDAYLRVEDDQGIILAQDDDGGERLNSRLFFRPPRTATYVIVATSFNGRGGPYRFSIQEQNFGGK